MKWILQNAYSLKFYNVIKYDIHFIIKCRFKNRSCNFLHFSVAFYRNTLIWWSIINFTKIIFKNNINHSTNVCFYIAPSKDILSSPEFIFFLLFRCLINFNTRLQKHVLLYGGILSMFCQHLSTWCTNEKWWSESWFSLIWKKEYARAEIQILSFEFMQSMK